MEKMLDVVFILDKSGSMSGSEEHTISSFNEYLLKEKKNSFKTRISTILFSNDYSFLHERVDVSKVKKLTSKDYYVDGCTALYDALGKGITYMDQCMTNKVLFIIITDGYENASREFSKEQIKRMIKKHSKWEFVYIGADIDSYATGGEIGIKKENIANYKKSKIGTHKMFEAVVNFECAMMSDEAINWKEELNEYIEKNKD